MKTIVASTLIISFLTVAGCQSTYYKTMEAFGHHKRDLLVSRIQDARDAQEDAKEQFQSALEKFSAIIEFRGGKLEEKYGQLKGELEKSESRAKAVRNRISDVETLLYSKTNIRHYRKLKIRHN